MLITLLQITTTTAVEPKRTLWEYIQMGGWVMYPILALTVLGIYISIERYLTLRKADKDPAPFLAQIRAFIMQGELDKAKAYCDATNSPFARMIHKGISRLGMPLNEIKASIENVANLEVFRLEKSLYLIATVAGAAPMLGFLGTVTGLMAGFNVISTSTESVNPAQLADGIFEAMVTTVAGLSVGIPAYIAYNFLVGQVSSVIFKMEQASVDFIDMLQEPAK